MESALAKAIHSSVGSGRRLAWPDHLDSPRNVCDKCRHRSSTERQMNCLPNANPWWSMNLRRMLLVMMSSALTQLAACKDSNRPAPVQPGPSSAPSAATETLRFPEQGVSYRPLPGWANRRAEQAELFVDGDAGARRNKPAEGEMFHLSAPSGSGFSGVDLRWLPMPEDADPVALLQKVDDAERAAYAKRPLQYMLTVPPRPIRNEQGIAGAEMSQRWDRWGDGKWQRTAQRIFVRSGRAYLLNCGWLDRLGDAPPELPRVLEALRFD